MPEDLIESARREIEGSDPPVRAAGLLHLARVVAAFDSFEAWRLLEAGLALLPSLPEPDRDDIASEAVLLAAAVAPARGLKLLRNGGSDQPHIEAHFIGVLLNGGRLEEAAGYLSDPIPGREYPFPSAGVVMSQCAGADRQRILRAAVRAWREGSGRPLDFFRLFSEHWRLLPPEEAAEIVRDAVEAAIRSWPPPRRVFLREWSRLWLSQTGGRERARCRGLAVAGDLLPSDPGRTISPK